MVKELDVNGLILFELGEWNMMRINISFKDRLKFLWFGNECLFKYRRVVK